ncbi:MAG: hypothetical protein ACKPKO_13065, partial [Candidatus Fonsibacter sp.]
PDEPPESQGTIADLVALASLEQASDRLPSMHTNGVHLGLVEVSLSTLVNVSTFTEGVLFLDGFTVQMGDDQKGHDW